MNARRWAFRTLLLCGAAVSGCSPKGGRTVLTVYSPHGKELLAHYEKGFEQDNPDVDVQWVEMSSQDILDRLRAEKAHPNVDIWFGAPSELFERAAREGLLDTISPSFAAAVSDDAKDAGRRWYGTYLTPEVIAFNTNALTDSAAPNDWTRVGEPAWRGKLIIRDPVASGTMRAIFGAIMQRSMSETGKTDSGWALLRRLDRNTKEYTPTPAAMYDKLTRGDGWITLYNMPDIAALAREKGAPLSFKLPTSGTPVLVDAIALVKNANNRTFAMRYIEYVMSKDAQVFAADSLLRIPARTDIADSLLPGWITAVKNGIKPMPLDNALMADSLDNWMRAWDSAVRGRNAGR